MDAKNEFDKKLETWKERIPEEVAEASIFVNDTLDLCLSSAKTVFGDNVAPEVALAIYDRIVARIKNNNQSNSG